MVKSHNPFAVNDVFFARQFGFPVERTNAFGCSLIYGHPQGTDGRAAIVELIAELEARRGGVGLFTGCAAGDTGRGRPTRRQLRAAARGWSD